MLVLAILGVGGLMALIFGPQFWIKWVMEKHGREQPDFPGTGGELARHLLDRAGLANVKLERIDGGDHYSPEEKVVRLSARNFDGKSVTAVAVASIPPTERTLTSTKSHDFERTKPPSKARPAVVRDTSKILLISDVVALVPCVPARVARG